MKEKGKNLKDQINEKEIGKLPEKDFRVMIVKMIQDLRNRTENMQELIYTLNKDLEETEDKIIIIINRWTSQLLKLKTI